MCICLYMSNINFFYSNFLSFASVPVPHHSGVGWLCTGIAFEVAQSNITPGKKLCLQKAQFSLCSSLSQDNWTGLVWHCHPMFQPVSTVKYLDRCFYLSSTWIDQSQPPLRMVPCATERAGLDVMPRGVKAHAGTHKEVSCKNLIQMRANLGAHHDPGKVQDHDPIEVLSKLSKVTQTTSDY